MIRTLDELSAFVDQQTARIDALEARIDALIGKEGTKRIKGCPKSVDEVADYCRLRGNTVDPHLFFDHSQARGWAWGPGKPMRDWQAAVRTWERSGLNTPKRGAAPETLRNQASSFLGKVGKDWGKVK